MHRFFISPEQFDSHRPVVSGQDVRHMVKVLRLKPGDLVELLDGAGRAARASVEHVGKEEVVLLKMGEFTPGGAPPVQVILVQGLARGEKMDLVIQKCTELGVSGVIPLVCHRSVVRLDDGKSIDRQARWQRVALEAAKQCRRPDVPVVSAPQKLPGVLSGMPEGSLAVMPWEGEESRSFSDALAGETPGRVYVIIGPEGGFEKYEVEEARRAGVVTVSLGPRILRTETAGLVCVALIMHRLGDLG
ncbi:MAG: 16S rRNA (uracil(1498)-N(3))-methyltransferase [Bacillota bacterium]